MAFDLFLRERIGTNLVLNDIAPLTEEIESVEADIFWRYEDEPDADPQFLTTCAAGKTASVPFDFADARPIRLFLISKQADGNQLAYRAQEGTQLLFNPNIETLTPTIGQLTNATNTQVTLWANDFTEKAKYREVEVSAVADFATRDLLEIQEAADFGVNNLLPNEVLITKTGVSGAVTKYVRIRHSSNGETYGNYSNVLTIVFADSGGTGGSGGDGDPPCFIGSTKFKLINGSEIDFQELFGARSIFIGQPCAFSFDEQGNRQSGIVEEVFRHWVGEYFEVEFSDGTISGVTKEHPYFTENDYVAIGKLKAGDKVFNDENKLVEIIEKTLIKIPEGIYVYNARIRAFANYVADGKRVHNAKQIEL